VLVVHRSPLTRLGVREVLKAARAFEICGETDGAQEGRSLFVQHAPELVLIGLSLSGGDGIELIKDLLKLDPRARIVVLSTREDALSVQRAFRAGACGYVLTLDRPEQLLTSLARAVAGQRFASDAVQRCILDDMAYGDLVAGRAELSRLSDRELQVFRGIAAGRGVTQLARELQLSVKTIETYRTQVRSKLGLQTSRELRNWATEWLRSTLGHGH
jgi:DNA-binding NarL/FixJ family response regulator